MARRRSRATTPDIEGTIRRASSIGAMERLAGVAQDEDSRATFWNPFMHLPGGQALDAGCAELKRRIRADALGVSP